jgi:FlaA1/EpsC-like NDP-sugar epimerase
LALIAEQNRTGNTTRFMAVRFGNVLGSSGSVIPIFRRQIANGGPITVTDPEVTRFFMTVEEAVGLVLQSATQGLGGEIVVLDMGQSVKIVDVARQMVALSGLREGSDIEIVFTGLQPGEKLYEEVQHISESLQATDHPRILRFVAATQLSSDYAATRQELCETMDCSDTLTLKRIIQNLVPEYTPWGI